MKIIVEEMKGRREATGAYLERAESRIKIGQKQMEAEVNPYVKEMNATDLETNQEVEVVDETLLSNGRLIVARFTIVG
jgi:hypothetical protein